MLNLENNNNEEKENRVARWANHIGVESTVDNNTLGFIGIFFGIVLGTQGFQILRAIPALYKLVYVILLTEVLYYAIKLMAKNRQRTQNQRVIFYREIEEGIGKINELNNKDVELFNKINEYFEKLCLFSVILLGYIILLQILCY